MCKYISFGRINSNYKYILYYAIFQLINQHLFHKDILNKIGTFDRTLISNHKIIQEILIGVFFISIFIFIYEQYQKKIRNKNDEEISIKKTYSNFSQSKLIYTDQLEGNISLIRIIAIIFLLVLQAQSMNTFYACGLDGLDFWMFEMLFIYFIFSKILSSPIYKHQKYSVYFVIISCTLMKIISSCIYYFDNPDIIYKTYKIIIPIGTIIFLLITYLRAYVACKVKWLMDLKYITSGLLLMIYGLMGAIICSIACMITTLVPCEDTLISYDEMINICRQKRTIYYNNTESNTFNHFDSYSVYFEKLLKGDGYDIFRNICLIIMKVIVIFMVKLFSILILKYLNPFFFICSSSIYYFFSRLIRLIFYYEDNEIKEYLDFITEIFSIFGILVYTELIELNFCDLNYNLKKNIINRSKKDSSIFELTNNVNESRDSAINSDFNDDE